MRRSMEQSERYIKMKKGGATEEDIQKAFNTPQEMTVFSYHGEVDTIMTPMDSIRYYKSSCVQDSCVWIPARDT